MLLVYDDGKIYFSYYSHLLYLERQRLLSPAKIQPPASGAEKLDP